MRNFNLNNIPAGYRVAPKILEPLGVFSFELFVHPPCILANANAYVKLKYLLSFVKCLCIRRPSIGVFVFIGVTNLDVVVLNDNVRAIRFVLATLRVEYSINTRVESGYIVHRKCTSPYSNT